MCRDRAPMAKNKQSTVPGGKGFLALPKALMECTDFREASPVAIKVLMVIGGQFNGRNNGDLACTKTMMDKWGGISPATLSRAKKELIERNLIRRTRTHHWRSSGARCELFALSWEDLHECKGKDLDESVHPWRKRKLK